MKAGKRDRCWRACKPLHRHTSASLFLFDTKRKIAYGNDATGPDKGQTQLALAEASQRQRDLVGHRCLATARSTKRRAGQKRRLHKIFFISNTVQIWF